MVGILQKRGVIRLRDIVRLFRRELRPYGEDWRDVLFPHSRKRSPVEWLKRELDAAENKRKWQSVLAATNEIIEEFWLYLDEADKNRFMRDYHRLFMARRNPMPVQNAVKIHQMMQQGQLTVKGGLKHMDALSDGTFFAQFDGGEIKRYDWVINATGSSRNLERAGCSGLLLSLLHNGYARRHAHGGIDVDFQTGAVVDQQGRADLRLRAVGHITCGTYYYTGSLEMIAKRGAGGRNCRSVGALGKNRRTRVERENIMNRTQTRPQLLMLMLLIALVCLPQASIGLYKPSLPRMTALFHTIQSQV